MKKIQKTLFISIFLFAAGILAPAETYTWTGSVNGVFTNPNNWKDSLNNTPTWGSTLPAATYKILDTSLRTPYLPNNVTLAAGTTKIEVGTNSTSASLILGDFSFGGSVTIEVNEKGTLGLSGTPAQITLFNNSQITLQPDSTVWYYGGYPNNIFPGPYQNFKVTGNINADSLTVEKTTSIGNNNPVTIKAATQTYKGAVTVQKDVTFDAATSVTFTAAANVNAGTQNLSFTGGGAVNMQGVTAGTVDAAGASSLTVNGPVNLSGDLKAKNLTVNTATVTAAKIEVSQTATVSTAATITAQTQTYTDAVTVNANTTFNASSNLTFGSDGTVGGTGSIIVSGNGTVNIQKNINLTGGTSKFEQTGTGAVNIGNVSSIKAATQIYKGAVTINADTEFNTSTALTFKDTVSGSQKITLSGIGNVNIGNNITLNGNNGIIEQTGTGNIKIDGSLSSVTLTPPVKITAYDQTYKGAVTINTGTEFHTVNSVNFGAAVNAGSNSIGLWGLSASTQAVNAGTMTSHASSTLRLNGDIILTGDLNTNGSVTGEGNIDVTGPWQHSGTGNITAKGNIKAGTFTQTAAGSTLVFDGSTPQTLQIGPASQIQNLKNNGNLKLNSDITIIGKFENTGTFDAQTKTVKLDPPANGTVTITGTGTAINTKFHNLRLSGAGRKKLVIDKKISVLGNLTLTGTSTDVLTVNGGSSTGSESPEIVLTGNQTGGQYLKVRTNIPITGGTYTAEDSLPDGSGSDADIQAGKPENWIFTNYNGTLTWKGSVDSTWNDRRNWEPALAIPGKDTDVTIPVVTTQYPKLTAAGQAKSITVDEKASLDLVSYVIKKDTGADDFTQLTNKGTLRMMGTVETAGVKGQKEWLENTNPANKITHLDKSTIEYYNNSADYVWIGPYKNLTLNSRSHLKINNQNLTVQKKLTIKGSNTHIDTGTGTQTYEGEVDAKNSSVPHWNIEFTASSLKMEKGSDTLNINAENIKVNATTWTSSANINAASITANGSWTSKKGNIKLRGGLTVGSFNQENGAIIFNGNGGTLKYTSASGQVKIKTLNIASSATVNLGSDIIITEKFENKGTFNATTSTSPPAGYSVTLEHPSTGTTPITVVGNNDKNKTKFYTLKCILPGTATTSKNIRFQGNISVYGNLTLRGKDASVLLNLSGTNPIGTAQESPPGSGNYIITPNPNHSGTIYINAAKNPSFEPDKCKWLGIATNLPIASLDSNTYTCTASESAPTGNFEDILPLLMAGHPKNWIFTNLDKLAWTGETNTDWNNTGNWRPRPSAAPQGTEYVTIRNVAAGNNLPVLGTGTYRANEVDIRGNVTLDLGGSVIFKGTTGSNTTKLTSKGTLKLKGTPAQKTWFEVSNADNKIHLDMDANTTTVVYYNDLQSEETINIWKGLYNKLEIEKGKLKIGSTPDTIEAKEFTVQSNAEVNLNSDMKINSKFKNLGKFNATTSDTTGYTITLDNTNNITITGKDESSIQDTKFHNLKLENAAGKTLTIEKKIYIAGDLTLSGASGTPLTIDGSNSAEIHLKTSHGLTLGIAKGNYLTIYTGNVKIRPEGKYYVVKDSKDDSNTTVSKNGWVFVKPNLSIVNSFAKPNDKHIYLLFDDDSLSTEEFHSLKALSHTLQITDGVTTYTSDLQTVHKEPSSYIPFGHSLWKIQLDGTQKFNPDDIINSSYQVSLNYFGTSKTKLHISDIGINIVKPQKAFNSIVLRSFDADHDDKALPTLDIKIPTERTVTSDNFKLYFFSVNTLSSDNKFWYPIAMIQPPNPPTPGNLSAFAAVLTETATEYTGTPAGGLLNFIIPSTDPFLKEGKIGQFMYVYNGWLPCVRLKDKAENDILSFDVWNFKIVGVQIQKGGVSIFENVVNPYKGQSATIAAHLKKSGMLTIQIMTLDGNIVRTLTRSYHNAGDHFYLWDGRNNGGNPVASGMYFVRIAGPDIDEVRKILIIK